MTTHALDPRALALGDLQQELDNTRRVVERIPGDRLDWRPHERSRSLGELGAHIAYLPFWLRAGLEDDGHDLAARSSSPEIAASTAELLDTFDRNRRTLEDALASLDPDRLGEPWTLRAGEQVVFTLPRHAVFRRMGLSHLIHHRGQLTVYLRLLDVPVPGMYGPSADERRGEGD